MSKISHANRGMGLETLIEYANAQYAAKGIAQIQKVHTPWKVVRSGKQIVSAFPEKKSTVDYIGDFKGKSIAYEAKSTRNKTSFPLSNFDDHQIEFLRKWQGIKFVLIEWELKKEIYFVPFVNLINVWDNQKQGNRKSIPYEWFTWLPKVENDRGIVLDYLKYAEVTA